MTEGGMTNYHVSMDEWYPVYSLSNDGYYAVEPAEFSAAECARIEAAFAEFREVQELIAARFGMDKPIWWANPFNR